MQPLRVYSVIPRLPENLRALRDLSYNCWFAWNDNITELFTSIDHDLWVLTHRNPVEFLNRIPQRVLGELSRDEFFVQRVNEAKAALDSYLGKRNADIEFPDRAPGQPAVAYFSLEYGIAPCLPMYSGGLGILAGDHLKSSSDLNFPLVGVGLAYREGYFRQYMTPDGWQQERYPDYDFEQLPMSPVNGADGCPLLVRVELKGDVVSARAWKVAVGRVTLYLLDSNIQENPPHYRQITARLYGGDLTIRLWQEILLGIGGVRLLKQLGLNPQVLHMNEGHCAFAALERLRMFMIERKLSFEAAGEVAASSSVFTTHTPVPAGNERFPVDLMQSYFEAYARSLGLSFKTFLALGREDPFNDSESFCMTVLALRLSRFNNGVSKLHGRISRHMWRRVWPRYPEEDIPITSVTNGVHMPTWVAEDMAQLYEHYLGIDWREDPDYSRVWHNAKAIPDVELWRTHERLRERLVDFVRKRLRRQLLDKGAPQHQIQVTDEVLDPQALTIGFARRFATYKRANMLLMDKDRLLRLVSDKSHPVQFIFAGKAHPADDEGKKLMQELIRFCRREECRYSMVFLEDYDMKVAQRMVQGCDVWLNTPLRPLEACGTSGMKAMANGVLHLSTLDGWWDEAWTADNSVGFAIGRGEEYEDHGYQNFVESRALYNLLENEIIPEFYDRDHGNLPRAWVRQMKRALTILGPTFNAHRMVEEYARIAYLPAYNNFRCLSRDAFAPAKELAAWRMDLMTKWDRIEILDVRSGTPEQIYINEPILVEAEIYLNGITPNSVRVEIYAGSVDRDGEFAQRQTVRMTLSQDLGAGRYLFRGEFKPDEAGRFGYTVRVMPYHPLLLDSHALGLIYWAGRKQ